MQAHKLPVKPKQRLLLTSEMIATFCRFYPSMWTNSAYETSDKVIPYPLFVLLLDEVPRLEARERVNQALAARNAQVAMHASEDGRKDANRVFSGWIKEAYPESEPRHAPDA